MQVGPLWINTALQYTMVGGENNDGKDGDEKNKEQEQDTNGEKEVSLEVTSAILLTNSSPEIFDIAGYHYCKLLSPARAMEWIYVDSLRMRDGLKNK